MTPDTVYNTDSLLQMSPPNVTAFTIHLFKRLFTSVIYYAITNAIRMKQCVKVHLHELRLRKQTFFFSFFYKFLLDTCPFLGPLIPLFRTSGDVSSGFQSQSGFCLIQTLQRRT